MEKKRKRIKIYSALEVANICGVVNQTAINWIKNGSLKAFTTPGGQYRVYAEHLVDFLKERGMKVPAEVLESLNDGFVNEKKILIIDTDRVAIKELRDSLADSLTGYSFISAVTSFDAGRLLMAEKPEIIILTEAFPELTVENLYDTISSRRDYEKPAIIFIADENSTARESRKADLFLHQPVEIEKLVEFINGFH
ncbi:MAG: helix-turn-helix domain-containing protein [Spirochaetia bacterium]|nr:helix-turn-helix domain-containing protein [Spirochaetia bacterium]MBR5016633.1 helix-turn-helix domain-containing protein [Spirochaetia bacterium]MBR5916118.1 helix-turn-helix domain-containing protein [Spirochaetia bacterium]